MKKNLKLFVLLFVIIGGITFYFRYNAISINPINENATTTVVTTMKVKIALLSPQMETSNKNNFRGCDVFELVERDVPISSMPLNAVFIELFSKKDIWMPGELAPGNFITSQKELFFDKADIQNGVAKIYLIGKIGPLSGVCDNPRLRIQLEETALQYPSIQTVEFYLNGIKNDLIFSQKGN
jgi:hypothetical protein